MRCDRAVRARRVVVSVVLELGVAAFGARGMLALAHETEGDVVDDGERPARTKRARDRGDGARRIAEMVPAAQHEDVIEPRDVRDRLRIADA